MADLKTFSRIPMRTWRWLGVNESRIPADIDENIKTQKLLVEAGKENEVVLTQREGGQYELQVHIEDGAKLHLVNAQLVPDDKLYTCRVKVFVGKGAEFSYTVVEAGAEQTATELYVDLAGDDSKADVWGLYFGDGKSLIDLNYVIRQGGKRTDANMQVRGALLGESEKIFRGTLDFLEGAKGSVGRENEEVVLLSPNVRNRSVPIMLSHEDDVDGHHAVSVGKMDEDKLFYLMSRGLDLSEAQRLVVEASFNPVLDRIPEEELKKEIDTYLQRRLSNG
ncbi:SufB/SufD family protein [Mitsuokella sp.]